MTTNAQLAVVLHLYNFTMWQEYSNYLKNVVIPFDLYVILPFNSVRMKQLREEQKQIVMSVYPNAQFFITENIGMDVGGFLFLLQYFKNHNIQYQYLLKLHSKTLHSWRKALVDPLLKSPDTFRHGYQLLETNPTIGMIGSRRYHLALEPVYTPKVHILLKEARLPVPPKIWFIGGTIFMIKFSLLKEWYDRVNLNVYIKQMVHGRPRNHMNIIYMLERLFGALVYSNGQIIHPL